MRECLICKRVFGDHIERCDRDRSPVKTTLPGIPIINNSYRLDERIGQGSLGIVYRGAQIREQGLLAIKLLQPEFSQADAHVGEVFLEESDAIYRTYHPNLVRVFDYGRTANDIFFTVMEHMEDFTLQSLIEREPEIPINRVVELMYQICDGVNFMHRQNRLHWDLKPANFFVVYDQYGQEQIKIADFGLARIKTLELCNYMPGARTHSLLSLPNYLSPEQCDGRDIDTRSEVYSLGVIFFQLLTGQLPFNSATYLQLLHQHINQPPPSPRSLRGDIPEDIETILLRALSKRPEDRFSSAGAFAKMLRMALTPSERHSGYLSPLPSPMMEPANGAARSLPPKTYPAPNKKITGSLAKSLINVQSEAEAAVINKNIEASGANEPLPSIWQETEARDVLSYIARILDNNIRSSKHLTLRDLNPDDIVLQLAEQLSSKHIIQDGDPYVPSLIKIFLPRMGAEKFKEVEAIFNSLIFVGNIYKYVRKMGFRLFNLLKVEVEMPQDYKHNRCIVLVNWPMADDISNGLEKVVEIKQQRVVSSQMRAIDIPRVALLQTINAAAYSDQFLIVSRVTNLGRFRNVIDHSTGEVLRRNALSFLQPVQPESPNNTISRQHAKIEFINGDFYVFDTGSTNGTRVNRREANSRIQLPVVAYEEGVLLKDRDIIQLGLALISFEIVATDRIVELADQVSMQQGLQLLAPGSTADIFRTGFVTTSLSTALVW